MRCYRLTSLLSAALLLFCALASAQFPVPDLQLLGGPYQSPNDAASIAAGDAAKGNANKHIRYLSLHNWPLAARMTIWQEASITVNRLSSKRLIEVSLPVDASITVLRVDLNLYGIDPAVWDRFLATGSGPEKTRFPEPYFNLAVLATREHRKPEGETKLFKGKLHRLTDVAPYTQDGVRYTKRWIEVDEVKVGDDRVRLRPGPWLDPRAIDTLRAATHSEYPIARADWFIIYSMTAPGYYDLLGLGDSEADFDKAFFLDRKLVKGNDVKAVVVESGKLAGFPVAHHIRGIIRFPTVASQWGGSLWQSDDYASSIGKDDIRKDPLREDAFAHEYIAGMRNRLHAFFLSDSKRKRLDAAVSGVASDSKTRLKLKDVTSAYSCIICHGAGGGIWLPDDRVRATTSNPLKDRGVRLDVLDNKVLADKKLADERIAELFFSVNVNDLADLVRLDVAGYTSAVLQATSVPGATPLTPKQEAERLHGLFVWYWDSPLDLNTVAREVGVEPQRLLAIIEGGKNIDPDLTNLTKTPPITIRRDQWEASGYASCMDLLIKANAFQGK